MTVDRFVADRSEAWAELDRLLHEARGRPERLGPARLRTLGSLYRAAAADLATARRRWPGEPTVTRLEDLVGRGRLAVYGRTSRRGTLWSFLSRSYWRRVAERPLLLLVATLLLFVPMVLTAAWGHADPYAAIGLVPGDLEGDGSPSSDLGLARDEQAQFSAEIMTNNIQVTFLALAGGATGGILTAVVLLYNGALIGALGGVLWRVGSGSLFLELVTPHGVLELSCIIVSGVAGLRMGAAVIDPGDRRRADALVDAARGATELALGTAPWLIVAGLVEGFVTPTGLGLGLALTIGVALGILYWTLVLVRGRPAISA